MNQREKLLASCVAGVVGISIGYTLIKSQVYEPGKKLTADIKKETELRDRLQVRLNGADKTVQTWRKQTGQTLSDDWFAAHQAFREDVSLLLKRNNLTDELKISKYKERIEKKGAREGFVELPLSVRVNGRLGDLDNFLKDYFQRPYFVRLDKLTLGAEQTRKSKKKKSGPAEPKLSIVMTLSTLVLPKVEDADHPTFDLAALNDPDPEAEPVPASAARLRREDPVEYNEIAHVNFFKIYESPPPPKTKIEPKSKQVVEKPEPPPPPPKLDPRRDAHKFVVSGMGWLDDGPIAYIVKTDQPGDPPDEYRLNDEIDDGRLVLVVPEGLVVRVTGERGRHQLAKNYFYPLGSTFKDREEVDPSEHPKIARQLRVVLKR